MQCTIFCDENVHHLMIECPAYDSMRTRAISEYIRVMGKNKFDEVISLEYDGLEFFLGLVNNAPYEVMEVTKELLANIWRHREVLVREAI